MTEQVCKPDSTGVTWFKCTLGTVGCPRFHHDRSPHCIECVDPDATCRFGHDPPAIERSWDDYVTLHPEMAQDR